MFQTVTQTESHSTQSVYSTVLFCTVLYCTVMYCTVLSAEQNYSVAGSEAKKQVTCLMSQCNFIYVYMYTSGVYLFCYKTVVIFRIQLDL